MAESGGESVYDVEKPHSFSQHFACRFLMLFGIARDVIIIVGDAFFCSKQASMDKIYIYGRYFSPQNPRAGMHARSSVLRNSVTVYVSSSSPVWSDINSNKSRANPKGLACM